MNICHNKYNNKRGFTLLFASLISALLLAISLAIFSISNKELVLSTTARDSQYAFYAADAGLECALYWDLQYNAFSISSPSTIVCNGLFFAGMGGAGYNNASTFEFTMSPASYCTKVSVTKYDLPKIGRAHV